MAGPTINFKAFKDFSDAHFQNEASMRVFLSGKTLSNASSTSKATNGTSGVKLSSREIRKQAKDKLAAENRDVRQQLLDAVFKEVGVNSFNKLPRSVKKAFKVGTFKDDMALDASGKTVGSNRPLTARRIKAVVDAVLSEKDVKKWEKINQDLKKNMADANEDMAEANLASSFVGMHPEQLTGVLRNLISLAHNPRTEQVPAWKRFKFKDVVLGIRNLESVDDNTVKKFMSSKLNGLAELKTLLQGGDLNKMKNELTGVLEKGNPNDDSDGIPDSRDQKLANGMLRFVIHNWLKTDEARRGK